MATPRIFISSTCYDLREIRSQLYAFIQDIGYEPVMSESGDIFYDYNKHVQDACNEEIEKCNMFVLIIGNNYGTIYHKKSESNPIPDSVTLEEFRKALDVGMPKYIFINHFVQHDFENYRNILKRNFNKYFSENKDMDDVEKQKKRIKDEFDLSYQFPQDAYRYIFYFLDIIYTLDINNAIYPFESFENIRDTLRRQWAGYFFNSLTKESSIAVKKLEVLGDRLDRIEHQLRLLVDGTSRKDKDHRVTIDVTKLANDFDIKDIKVLQSRIRFNMSELLYTQNGPRIEFKKEVTKDQAIKLFNRIGEFIQKYKWSDVISITIVFSEFEYLYWKNRTDVPYEVFFELYNIYNRMEDNDKDSFLNTICLKLNECFKPEKETETLIVDDLPYDDSDEPF